MSGGGGGGGGGDRGARLRRLLLRPGRRGWAVVAGGISLLTVLIVVAVMTLGAGPHWTAELPPDRPQELNQLIGGWNLGDAVMRGQADGLTAYGVEEGDVRWTYQPEPGSRICAISTGTTNGIGFVVSGSTQPGTDAATQRCDRLTAVGTADGAPRWELDVRRVLDGQFPASETLRPEVVGAVVVLPIGGRVLARNALDGSALWTYDARVANPVPSTGPVPGACRPVDGVAGPGTVMVVKTCASDRIPGGGAQPVAELLDVNFGMPLWNSALPVPGLPGDDRGSVAALSAGPPAALYRGADGTGTVVGLEAVTGAATLRANVAGVLMPDARPRSGAAVPPQPAVLTTGTTLIYAGASQDRGPGGCQRGSAVALDFAARTVLWSVAADDGCALTLLSGDSESVLALDGGGTESAPRVMRIARANGAAGYGAELSSAPDGGAARGAVFQMGGRLVVLPSDGAPGGAAAYAIGD